MPLFMDFHDDLKLPQSAIDGLTQATKNRDVDEFGVRQVELFHNAEGKVYCLLEAPDAESVHKHHEALHVSCGDVHEVKQLL
jgi:arginine repressor